MPILGIEYGNCINCKKCITQCVGKFWDKGDKVIFDDKWRDCILCGHCIAVCPTDAILYENMGSEPYAFEGIKNIPDYIPYDIVFNFMNSIRSTRQYKKVKVPEELLRKVVRAMQIAPTGSNIRDQKFMVITDPELIKTLGEAVLNERMKLVADDPVVTEQRKISAERWEVPLYHDAPALIIMYCSSSNSIDRYNIGIAITYGRLAAHSLGLATCWNGYTTGIFEQHKDIVKIAGVRGKSWGVLEVGYPAVQYERIPPRPEKKIKGLD
ncbi:MAG: nitroreductase family protein [Candidatus Lokiarchaeota archaeon]|nr:nitroreductase family protein [Candidatus Lokiarchaeota archaeon]